MKRAVMPWARAGVGRDVGTNVEYAGDSRVGWQDKSSKLRAGNKKALALIGQARRPG
jgi:hypothetical protein